jgi:site-specific recombinase XerD
MSRSIFPLFDSLPHTLSKTIPSWLKEHSLNTPYLMTEYQYAVQFLCSYRGSEATFNAYRREVERLLQWSWWILEKSIQQVKRTDFEQFIEFCQHPLIQWIGVKHVPRYLDQEGQRVPNPQWRPFVSTVSKLAYRNGQRADPKHYVLGQNSLQALFAICESFYNYLIQEDYMQANPVAQIRQKSKFIRKHTRKHIVRRLTPLQWSYVLDAAERLAKQQPEKHERTLFIMKILYGMYLRISELVASKRWHPQMGHFHCDRDNNWWFTTVGKGNKERIISVSDDLLAALKRYRISLNLSRLPTVGERTPLIPRNNSLKPITSTRRIRKIVQDCFDKAQELMRNDALSEEAEALKVASVHWLRHTGISDDIKNRPREHVRDDAGHASSAITDRYIDITLRERHASAKKKKLNPLDS